MLNRLAFAILVLSASALQARNGGSGGRRFLDEGLPSLQAYVAFIGLAQAHLALWPNESRLRRTIAIFADAAFVSYGLWLGGAASAFLLPLYLWMILGNGMRLGVAYMAVSVISAVVGFGANVWATPFWRENVALSAGLSFAIVTMPVYGALLLRRIAEARAEAERASQAKTLLLANVSHELRTPLTAILGLGDMLKKTGLDGGQREMVQTICGAANVLLRHIEGLLTVSRDEIGADARQVERVDLYALLISLRAMLAVEADKKGVRLGLAIEGGTPRHIRSEPGLLLDVVQNLGGNAVKFTPAGAVAIHVAAVNREGHGLVLRVEVRDTGIGVDAAAQERIFDAFVQAGPEIGAHFGGAGLGLAIARRRLEARGGSIGVESHPGHGALFWFELAIERDDSKKAPRPQPPQAPPASFAGAEAAICAQSQEPVYVIAEDGFDALALARRFALAAIVRRADPDAIALASEAVADLVEASGGREEALVAPNPAARGGGRAILLAEDNGVNRMIFERILLGGGYRVTSVADGEAALDAILSGTFDLILLDLNMPGIDGLEVARLYQFARVGAERAPIIALTADAVAERRKDCQAAGMAACLVKPIAPEALLDALDDVLRAVGPQGAIPPAGPSADRASDVDKSSIAALARLGGEEFVRKVVAEFIGESAQITERMVVAVEQGDLEAFRREAHALESSAGNVGAAELARLCRKWRARSPEAFVLYGDDCLDDLRGEWGRTITALNRGVAQRANRAPGGRGAAA